MEAINDQITQSQSVGNLPIPRTNSRLDTINEAKNEMPYDSVQNGYDVKREIPKNPSPPLGRLTNNRNHMLGGIGGSIITSSGINQNFKEYAN